MSKTHNKLKKIQKKYVSFFVIRVLYLYKPQNVETGFYFTLREVPFRAMYRRREAAFGEPLLRNKTHGQQVG